MKITLLQTTLAVTFAAFAQHAAAQTWSLSPGSMGTVGHESLGGNSYQDLQLLFFTNPPVQLNDYDTVQVTVSAPTGEMWTLSDPAGSTDVSMNLIVAYNEFDNNPFIGSGSLQMDLVSGSPGTITDSSGIATDGQMMEINDTVDMNGSISFTSLTETLAFNPSSLSSATLGSFYIAYIQYGYTAPTSTDPGALLSLQPLPAPEPSSLTLLGVGALGALFHLRNRRKASA